ncbi:retrovirus-related pol polyprotein from transposon TNT 1-94 [Tanacetum coccineum]
MGKSKKKPHKPKSEDTNKEKLHLLHMDLCGPIPIASVNGNKYILVIVDDYSRFTWVNFLRSKDEAPDFIIKFLKMIQLRLKVPVRRIRIDNGTEFVNQTLREYYEKDHPLENIIDELARPVSTRLQLHEQDLFCYYDAFLTTVEPKTYKDALTQACWIEVMQEEFNEFEHLKVWKLVPRPDKVMVITLKWIQSDIDDLGVDTPMVEKSKLDKDKEGKAVDPSHYRAFADADHAGCQDTRRSRHLVVCNFWEIDLSVGHQKGRKALRYPVRKLNILLCPAVQRLSLLGKKVEAILKSAWTEKDQIDNFLKERRYRYSNPMIQPEPEGSTQGYPLGSVEVLRFYTSAGNPVKEILLKLNLPDHRKLKDGGEVKEFQRSFRHSDTERLSRSDEVLKLKNFKKDATLKLFKSTNQERLLVFFKLCDANYKVLFTKTQGTIYNQNDKVVLIAPRIRDVYVIDMSSFNKESNACFFAKASPSVNWLWHKRLSHLNFKNINNLAKHNLVSRIPSLTFSKDKNCSACEKGKHHKASFKTKRSFSINKSLHLCHMDLFGPVKPQTISHNKYTLVIVDEYSRYTWVFCLTKKSDAADCIMSFVRKMENLNEVRVKELRNDNGTEFKNHKLEEFCDEKDI